MIDCGENHFHSLPLVRSFVFLVRLCVRESVCSSVRLGRISRRLLAGLPACLISLTLLALILAIRDLSSIRDRCGYYARPRLPQLPQPP